MKAIIYDAAGTVYELPVLLRWDVSHGFCSPCDSFDISFLYDAAMLPILRAACRFYAEHEGETVFSGIVDEVEIKADSSGCIAELHGRGNQALLLDSEAESADYYGADTAFILDRHVRALGVTDIDVGACAGKSASLSVSSGESHWSVVQRYAEFCLGVRPRFTPGGKLILDGGESGRTLTVDGSTAVTEQMFAQERYGVISEALVKSRARYGGSVKVENESFSAIGGQSRRVISVPRKTGFDAMRHTGAYQIEKSGADFVRCRLTVPQCFAAFPGDRVLLEKTPLGVTGEYFVSASRCYASGTDCGTVLDLRQTYAPTLKNG